MQRSSRLPFLILGLLTVLAVGMAVLGLSEAPPTADLTVHNGAGETLTAPSFTARFTYKSSPEVIKVQFLAPDQVTETLVRGGPTGRPPESRTVKGPSALKVLEPVSELLKIDGFVQHGSTYVGSQPIADLIPASEAREVSGTIRYAVTVTGGYVVKVAYHETVLTPEGTETDSGTFHVTTIGNAKAPTV